MSVRGLNHITLAVVDLDRSLAFYRDLLGLSVRAVWPEGAYLEAGSLWLCLSVDPAAAAGPNADYTHIAFDVDEREFHDFAARVEACAPSWRDNRSEGASIYILDPDCHRIDLHVGSLETRLAHYRAVKPAGLSVMDYCARP